MSVTSVDTDYDNLTTTLVADFDAPIDEVWQLWADPRKLERWWGPPTYPATFEKHVAPHVQRMSQEWVDDPALPGNFGLKQTVKQWLDLVVHGHTPGEDVIVPGVRQALNTLQIPVTNAEVARRLGVGREGRHEGLDRVVGALDRRVPSLQARLDELPHDVALLGEGRVGRDDRGAHRRHAVVGEGQAHDVHAPLPEDQVVVVEGAQHRAVDHHRLLLAAARIGVAKRKSLGELEVELHRSELPLATDRVAQHPFLNAGGPSYGA